MKPTRLLKCYLPIRALMWQRKVPPVARRGKLWRLRGRLHQGHGYYSPFERVGLPIGRKPYLRRTIHNAESRAMAGDQYE